MRGEDLKGLLQNWYFLRKKVSEKSLQASKLHYSETTMQQCSTHPVTDGGEE